MSNYIQTNFFTPLDSLPVGNPAKIIVGTSFDTEFGNIASAIASKANTTGLFNGPITIPAAPSGNTLTVTGTNDSAAIYAQGSATSGQSFGIVIYAGTTSADSGFQVYNVTGTTSYFKVAGDGGVSLNGATPDYGIGSISMTGFCYSEGGFVTDQATYLMENNTPWTNGAGSSTGTLTNSPAVGPPTKWLAVNDSGTIRHIPAW